MSFYSHNRLNNKYYTQNYYNFLFICCKLGCIVNPGYTAVKEWKSFGPSRRCHMHLCPLCNTIRSTLLHKPSCPPGRCCIMQVCPSRHICICSCVRPSAKPSLQWIKRHWSTENTFAFFFIQDKYMWWMSSETFGRCNH